MSEYSGKQDRGQDGRARVRHAGRGPHLGPLFASVLLARSCPTTTSGGSCSPSARCPAWPCSTCGARINETPRFAMAGGAADEAQAAIEQRHRGRGETPPPTAESKARNPMSVAQGFLRCCRANACSSGSSARPGAWALLDFCYYGNTISTPEILKLLNPHASLLHNTLVQLAIFAIFAVPGYVVAILLLDKSGRRSIQVLGFGMMGLMFLLIGLIPAVTTTALPFAAAVRDQLLLHRVRAQHDDVHLSRPRSSRPGPHDRAGISAGRGSWARSSAPSCSRTSWPPRSASAARRSSPAWSPSSVCC